MLSQKLLAAATLTLVLATAILPAAEPMLEATPNPAAREKMAKVHDQMSACLRSEKPMSECQSAMKAAHDTIMGPGKGMKMAMDKGCGKMGQPGKPEDAAAHSH